VGVPAVSGIQPVAGAAQDATELPRNCAADAHASRGDALSSVKEYELNSTTSIAMLQKPHGVMYFPGTTSEPDVPLHTYMVCPFSAPATTAEGGEPSAAGDTHAGAQGEALGCGVGAPKRQVYAPGALTHAPGPLIQHVRCDIVAVTQPA